MAVWRPVLLACLLAHIGLPPSHVIAADFGRGRPYENALERVNVAAAKVAIDENVALRLSTSTLSRSGETAAVYWSGVSSPRFDDLLAVYVPWDADPNATAPVKYTAASRSPTHLKLGAGSLEVRLLNLRQPFSLALLRGGLEAPTLVARSPMIEPAQPNEPTGGHLSLTGRPGEMQVQWVTRDAAAPRVRWGLAPDRLHSEAAATIATYTRAELCGPPANSTGWLEPGSLHAAVMTGLAAGTRYFYQYGSASTAPASAPAGSSRDGAGSSQDGRAPRTSGDAGAGGGGGAWSEVASFVAPPAPGPGAEVRLLAVADLGAAEPDGWSELGEFAGARATLRALAAEFAPAEEGRSAAEGRAPQLLVHNGDVSYARGFGALWDAFLHDLGPVVRSVPYMTTIGNHERDWPGSGDRFSAEYDSGGECGVPYYRRTRMPARGEDSPWYSFDFGPVHFLQYSTEHAFEPGSAQHAFIESDLAAVDRSVTPWVVVGGHRPMYVDSTWVGWGPDREAGDQYVADKLRQSLEPLLLRHRVDVTWHGHHHSYQRTCPVYQGRCRGWEGSTAKAPVHLVIGHAGAAITPNIHFLRPHIFEVVKLQHGYLRVTANATHLHHQVVASADGQLMDELLLSKPLGWAAGSNRQGSHHRAEAGGGPGQAVGTATA